MTHPQGGFYSAEDAESAGKEGSFYTWTPSEVATILEPEGTRLFCELFNIAEHGNFEGKCVLYRTTSIEKFAEKHGLNPLDFSRKLEEWLQRLFMEREKRPHPSKDDKILSSWNGLMIYTLALAGAAFGEEKYLVAAERAAQFIQEQMWANGLLARRWREGSALFTAGLDEYGFMIRGLLRLFEIGRGTHWLVWAMDLADILSKNFKAEGGAFYDTDGSDGNLLLRKCTYTDGAEPSGNAIHCENLLRLHQITQLPRYRGEAQDILRAVQPFAQNYPPGYIYHEMNIHHYWDKQAPTIIVALNEQQQFFSEIRSLLFGSFFYHHAIIWRRPNDTLLGHCLPWVSQYEPLAGKTTLYICHQGRCEKPLNEISDMIEAIHKL